VVQRWLVAQDVVAVEWYRVARRADQKIEAYTIIEKTRDASTNWSATTAL